jgi:hypothetical protein
MVRLAQEIVPQCLWAIAAMCMSNPVGKAVARRDGLLPLVVGAMQRHARLRAVQAHAAAAIRTVCVGSDEGRVRAGRGCPCACSVCH